MAVSAAAASTVLTGHSERYAPSDPYYCNPYYSYKADTEPALPSNAPPPSYESLFGKVKTAKSESHGVADFMLRLLGGLVAGAVGIVLIAVFVGFMLVIPVAMAVIGFLHIDDCPAQEYIPLFLIVGGMGWLIYQLLSCTEEARSKVHKWMSKQTCENDAAPTDPATAAVMGDVSPVRAPCATGEAVISEAGKGSPTHYGSGGPPTHSAVCIPDGAGGAAVPGPDAKELRASQRPMAFFETVVCLFLFIWFICGNVWVYGLYAKSPVTAEQCDPLVFTFSFWVVTGTYIMIGSLVVLACLCGCLITSTAK